MSEHDVGPGSVVAGTYRIVRAIGQGGMGEVFAVENVRTKAPLALKLLNARYARDAEALARFEREAQIASSLNHPNLVRVFDVGQLPDGRPFLVMELLEGQELAWVMREANGPLPLRRVLTIVGQIARGLAAVHARQIVHRDLKPSNVFLTPLPGTGEELVRVLDFGVSKVRDAYSRLTEVNAILGTPSYMSPEQASGEAARADAATDQWALAVMTYEMLLGRMAFPPDEGAMAVLVSVIQQEPMSAREAGVDLPSGVEAVVARAMAKRAHDRFPSVMAFARALEEAAAAAASPGRAALPAGTIQGRPLPEVVAAASAALPAPAPRPSSEQRRAGVVAAARPTDEVARSSSSRRPVERTLDLEDGARAGSTVRTAETGPSTTPLGRARPRTTLGVSAHMTEPGQTPPRGGRRLGVFAAALGLAAAAFVATVLTQQAWRSSASPPPASEDSPATSSATARTETAAPAATPPPAPQTPGAASEATGVAGAERPAPAPVDARPAERALEDGKAARAHEPGARRSSARRTVRAREAARTPRRASSPAAPASVAPVVAPPALPSPQVPAPPKAERW